MLMALDQKIGFIGAGNMATALIKGLIESGVYDKSRLLASDRDEEKLKNLADRFSVNVCASNVGVVRESSTVVLCIKPQNMRAVLEEVRGEVRDDHLLVSIAAGVPLSLIRQEIGREVATIRVMPNTPALVLHGMSALARGSRATEEQMALAKKIFSAVGETVEVEESMMDAVTALSGSGPGYLFRMMECFVEAGVAVGLEKEVSRRLVVQTFLGAAHLAKNSRTPLSGLREMVTSPGGTTQAGLAAFDRLGLERIVLSAVQAAHRRSVELGQKG
jgi:pyrroline-5-carboxylate reductase